MILPGTIGGPSAPLVESPLLFDLHGRDGSLTARTGQVGVHTRASSAPFTDSRGAAGVAVHSQPRWEPGDHDGDGVCERLGLRLTPAGTGQTQPDVCYWPIEFRNLTSGFLLYVRCALLAFPSVPAIHVACLGAATNAGNRAQLFFGGSATRVTGSLTAGASTSTSSVVAGAVAAQDADFEALLVVSAAGVATALQVVNQGAPSVAAAGAAVGIPATWASDRIYLAGTDLPASIRHYRAAVAVLPAAGWTPEQYLDWIRGV